MNSDPDGHTVLLGTTGPQAVAYTLFRSLPYKREQMFDISNLITGSNLLMINPKIPVNTVPEFVAWLKESKGKAAYGSSGTGTSTHLSARLVPAPDRRGSAPRALSRLRARGQRPNRRHRCHATSTISPTASSSCDRGGSRRSASRRAHAAPILIFRH